MTKRELVGALAETAGLRKRDAEAAIDGFAAVVAYVLDSDGELSVPGLGKFHTVHQAPRNVRDPQTGELRRIEGRRVPKFRASADLKRRVAS